jgi:uncharacterized repeat protein (TIGR01451 family)
MNANLTTGKTVASLSAVSFPANTGSAPVTYHVYTLLDPASANADCRPFSTQTVTVLPTFTPTITGSRTVCSGQTTSLTASTGNAYRWSNGASTQVVTVNAAGPYSVTVTSAAGCSGTATINMISAPTPNVVVSSATICVGETTTLQASGASNYLWNTGANTASIQVSGTVTTPYSVTGRNASGCQAVATGMLMVNGGPLIIGIVQSTACVNNVASLTINAINTGAGTLEYSVNGGPFQAGNVFTINAPISTLVNVVVRTQGSTCQATETIQVNCACQTPASLTFVPNALQTCAGQPVSFTVGVSGASSATLTSSGSGTLSQPVITGATAVTYRPSLTDAQAGSVTLTLTSADPDGSGACLPDQIVRVLVVNPVPNVVATSSTICAGQTIELTASGANTYRWNTGGAGLPATTAAISVSVAGTYSVTGISAQGCVGLPATATLTTQACEKVVDLALKKLIDKKRAVQNETVTYTIKVWNESNTPATNVVVKDTLNSGVQYVTSTASRGSYNPATKLWTIGSIGANNGANGDTVSLMIEVKVLKQGVWYNTAEINSVTERDVDSTPSNNSEVEDDLDRQCFTVPVELCPGKRFRLQAPANAPSGVWTRTFNGQSLTVGSGTSILIDQIGIYTFAASNGGCSDGGCCPIEVIEGTNCVSAKGSLGDFVWKDSNNNGQQDSGEPVTKGVIIELYKNNVYYAKDTTDALGKYGFTNLDSASYFIKVVSTSLPDDCDISLLPNASGVSDDLDSDVSPTTFTSHTVIIDPTPIVGVSLKDNPTLDVGLRLRPAECALALGAKPGLCDPATGTYSLTGMLSGLNFPTMGTLTIRAGGVQQVFNAPFGTSVSYSLTGLPANGQTGAVTAIFSASGSCRATLDYVAPANCQSGTTASRAALTAQPTSCDPQTGQYIVSGTVSFTNAPATGTLTLVLDGQTKILSLPLSSPQTYTFTGLSSDGSSHLVTATFSEKPVMNTSVAYVAPANCRNASGNNCGSTLTAVPGGCNPASNTYSLTGVVTMNNAPATGTMTVMAGGQTQVFNAPFGNSQPYSLTGLVSDGSSQSVQVVFSAAPFCGASVNYQGPSPCSPTVCATNIRVIPAGLVCGPNGYALRAIITFVNPPATGVLTVTTAGRSMTFAAPFNSPMSVVINGLTGGGTQTATASFANGCAGSTRFQTPTCSCVPEQPQITVTTATACIGQAFPMLTASVSGSATLDWYSGPTGGTPLAIGTTSFTPSGTVANAVTWYVQARNTASTCNGEVNPERIPVSLQVYDCNKVVDLALRKRVSKKLAGVGETLTYTIKVWNESETPATGVVVKDTLNVGVALVSSTATRGSYNPVTKLWTIGNIGAKGDTVTLTMQVRVLAQGVWYNTAEINSVTERDVDSTPGNTSDSEDDLDRQCFTVPIQICPGERLRLSAPTPNGSWTRTFNGQSTVIGSGNSVIVDQVGTYSFIPSSGGCGVEGCCPVEVVEGTTCCPANICVPITIKKRIR